MLVQIVYVNLIILCAFIVPLAVNVYRLKLKESALSKAVRKDVMEGEVPIPMTVICLEEAIKFGRCQGSKIAAMLEIKCHECGSKTKERYSALNGVLPMKLECIDCLVDAATKENISISNVTNFVDNRYMGAYEACNYIQFP